MNNELELRPGRAAMGPLHVSEHAPQLMPPFDPSEALGGLGGHVTTSLGGARNDYVNATCSWSRADFARGLSRLNRFLGQTRRPYSVAEHCRWVAAWLERVALNQGATPAHANDLALGGLVHDAPEAISGDMPRPLKTLPILHQYRWLEGGMAEATMNALGCTRLAFDLSRGDKALIHVADALAYHVECRDLRGGPNNPRWPQDRIVPVDDPDVAAAQWLEELERRCPA